MTSFKSKASRGGGERERSARVEPITIAHRRKATQQQLDQLRSVLAGDMPVTERAIVLRRYKTVCLEAAHLGMEVD